VLTRGRQKGRANFLLPWRRNEEKGSLIILGKTEENIDNDKRREEREFNRMSIGGTRENDRVKKRRGASRGLFVQCREVQRGRLKKGNKHLDRKDGGGGPIP